MSIVALLRFVAAGPWPSSLTPFMARVALAVMRRSGCSSVVETRFQALLFCDSRDFVQRHIMVFGLWEPALTFWMTQVLREGDLFVDVGANVGYHTLLGSRRVGASGEVVAVEASPGIYSALGRNIERSRAANVRTLNCAASDRPGTLPFYRAGDDNSGMSSTLSGGGRLFEAEVPADTLPALLSSAQWSRARLIKIDVEGGEWAVIAGMEPSLKNAHPELQVIVEISPDALGQIGKSARDVFELFRRNGFYAYSFENDYRPREYASSHLIPLPCPLAGPEDRLMDVLFSRVALEPRLANLTPITVRALERQLGS